MKWLLLCLLFCIHCANDIDRPELELLDKDVTFSELPLYEKNWNPVGRRIQNFGTGRSPLWLRSQLKNDTTEIREISLEVGVAYLDEIDFYLVKRDQISYMKSGVFSKTVPGQLHHRNPNFHFSLQVGEVATAYFKLKNSGLLAFPLRIWEQRDFMNKAQAEYIIHGLYFGALLSMLFYNLLIYLTIREKSFLFYCLYISSVLYVYLVLGGFHKQFFAQENSFFLKPGLFIASYLAVAFVLLFTSEFLNLAKIQKTFNSALTYFAVSCIFIGGLATFLPFTLMVKSMNYLLPFGSILMIISAYLGFRKGVSQSAFFLGAWIIVTIGIVLETLTNLGVFPLEFWIGRYGTQLSSLLEGILFSIAIGRRIRTLTREKEIVNAKLLLIEKDLEVARKIQTHILPLHTPVFPDAKIHVTYLPLRAVGGDFYDFHECGDTEFGVIVADVTGHGVSAAMDSSTVKISFKNEKHWSKNPEKLLERMNDFLGEVLNQRFVSAVYAYINLEALELQYATAGHPPMILLRKKEIIELESEGFLLGFEKNCEYKLFARKLEKGDKLLLYTDGLSDDISIEKTSTEVLKETIAITHYLEAEQFTKDLIASLNQKRIQDSDDITVLLIEIL
ncbi:hypothetical protein EHQ58_13875 [Leptospira ognonensis]|uniref:PPM-type phosphatase domain-containing protein n=1 Tax=Leptospira ognonensis TaxID=2484945 RepID=A0A4V3JQY2_9LEPT|nr:SpoIIE family protein phosphatase [Leptospira ognonensis]TGL57376.1 hypothetical protein EHQ58_13875 [Leptospira ognonensis]